MRYALALVVGQLLVVAPALAQSAESLKKDAEELQAAAKLLAGIGTGEDWQVPSGSQDAIGKNAPKLLGYLDKQRAAQQVLRVAEPVWAGFVARHLASMPAGEGAGNYLRQRFAPLGPEAAQAVSRDHERLEIAAEQMRKVPAANGAACVELLVRNGTQQEFVQNLAEIYRTKAVAEARSMLQICPQFSPGDAALRASVEAQRPKVEALLTAFRAAELQAAQARKWDGDVAKLAAGSPAALAQAGLAFLRAEKSWGQDKARGTTVIAVAVRGDWFVAERTLLGAPSSYGLPVHVAVRTNDLAAGLVQVFSLSLVTPGAKTAAPFSDFWVGDTWLLAAANLPAGKGK